MKKEKYHYVFMSIAELWASQSYCKREKVGAVLVKNHEVFAHGFNGTLMGNENVCEEEVYICPNCGKRISKKDSKKIDNAYYLITCPACKFKAKVKEEDFVLRTKDTVMHAEQNVILFSARDGKSTKDSTMYVTTSPCVKCASMIVHADIKRVIYKSYYKDESGILLLRKKGIEVIQYEDLFYKENKSTLEKITDFFRK